MSNRSLFSIALFFCMSFSAFAEDVAPVTNKASTEQVVKDVAPVDAVKTVETTTTTTITNTPTEQDVENVVKEETTENTEVLENISEKLPETQPETQPEPKKAIEKEESPEPEHAAGSFTVDQMWSASSGPVKIVLGTLLFMLVVAIGVGFERMVTLMTAKSQSRKIASTVGPLLLESKMKEALQACKSDEVKKSYLAHQLEAALTEFTAREDTYGIDAVERALDKHIIVESAGLRKGLNILATVGSTAPFVGLVGTIFGIINAFSQIGAEGGADLTTLAPAIGEALITTAFGIIVAIAGVWLFNYFTAVLDGISNDMAESAQEFMDWCHKRIIPKDNAAK